MNDILFTHPSTSTKKSFDSFSLLLVTILALGFALPWSQNALAAPQVKPSVATEAQPFPDTRVVHACPAPFKTRVSASDYSVLQSEMPEQWKPGNGLNGTKRDTFYAHTFYWKTQGGCCSCCQMTSATLNVTFRALSSGRSPSSSDAGNDGFYVVTTNGANVAAGVNGTGPVWSNHPFSAGNTVTKTVVITNPDILNSGHLSILVQDDTAITSASLSIVGCCVNSGCCNNQPRP